MIKKKYTLVVIPEGKGKTKHLNFSLLSFNVAGILAVMLSGILGFFVVDYINLRSIRPTYNKVLAENQHLRGEARILLENLATVKTSLTRVNDYSNKLFELINLRVKNLSQKTGIGPLSTDELDIAKNSSADEAFQNTIPLGLDPRKLVFEPVFSRLKNVGNASQKQAFQLQKLLSELTKKKSLLNSIPTIKPATGWIASRFGKRISPFTGVRTMHKGLDIAAPMGTPIHAPADGVVIFSGAKAGFGNFIMVAHGHGIVTRYGHNAQNLVQAGQKIKKGDQIATIGSTGRSTGPHVHYEVWVNGVAQNPGKFILDPSDQDANGTLMTLDQYVF